MPDPRRTLQDLLRGRNRRPAEDAVVRAVLDAASPGIALLDSEDRWLLEREFSGLCGPLLPPRPGLPIGALMAAREGAALGALATGQRVAIAMAS